ncbi:MAG: MMPL family transporter, partial [Cyclobacteriaceae bacterium]|nr:MMPL family transporter [Cyclobacteriaceae bacterium]
MNYLQIEKFYSRTMGKQPHQSSTPLAVKWAKWVTANRWLVLILSLILVGALGNGLLKLGFDGDYRVFFSKDNPQLQAFDELQNKYTQDDNVLIVIEPANGEAFSRETLAAIEQLTSDSWQTPYSSRVDAISNFQHTYAQGDELYVEDLVEGAQGKTSQELQKIQSIALKEPLLVNRLLNESGTLSAINITVKLPGNDISEGPEVVAFVRDLTEKFEKENPQFKTHLSGLIMLNAAFFEASQKDTGTLIPLMFLAIILTIFIATRTASGTLSSLVVIVFSIVAGMGFAGFMGIRLTPPSGTAPIIIMTLAVADSIHILITMVQGMHAGLGKKEAILESIRVNFMPVFITSFTTIIGFLSMNTSDVPPFHDLGNITAVGMAAAFIFSVTTLPALMMVLPVRIKEKSESRRGSNFLLKISDFVSAHPIKLVWASAFTIIFLTVLASNNKLNDAFIKYFDSSISFRADTDFISENLTGIYNIEFSLGAGESGGINNPDYLMNLQRFERWLEQQSEVIHVNAFTEVARRVNRSMHGDTASYYKVPQKREEAAQYLLLYEMSLPFGLDLNNQINVDKSETRLTATV